MGRDRLTAFSDGVIAVIITIMVLDLKAPSGIGISALGEMAPAFLCYVLSFIYVGIYWNNHHHFFHLVEKVDGAVLWANLHLLFWLSLVPFTTAWMAEHGAEPVPVATYGFTLLMSSIAWTIMQTTIMRLQRRTGSTLKGALGRDLKGKLSPALYLAGMGLAFAAPWSAEAVYALVALMWLVPDRRMERALSSQEDGGQALKAEPSHGVVRE